MVSLPKIEIIISMNRSDKMLYQIYSDSLKNFHFYVYGGHFGWSICEKLKIFLENHSDII